MRSRKIALVAGGVLGVAAMVVLALLSPPLLWVLLGVLQLAVVVLLLDTRRVLSARLFATTRKLERLITGRAPAVGSTGAAAATAVAGPRPLGGQEADLAAVPRADVRDVLRSRIFDAGWYELQAGEEFVRTEDAVRHYLARGRRRGWSPHPLFWPQTVARASWRTQRSDPLLDYVRGTREGRPARTSVVFDGALAGDDLPESAHGPLAAFLLHRSPDEPLPFDPAATGLRPDLSLNDVRAALVEGHARWRAREADVAPTRGQDEPPAPSEDLAASVREFLRTRGDGGPVVSVVLPTWNRSATVRAAIESVQAQSYGRWELLVADDGSVDDTALVLESEAARDRRVRPLLLPHRGVSATRNAALAAATGDYVAFLDSDKVWDRDFLATMLASMTAGGHEAAAAACEVSVGGETFYRSSQPTEASLRIANSVDQTAIVVARDVLERAGGFDESLRRAVDYDVVLKISDHADLVQVPYVGVRYSEDDQDPNRISEAESVAWNFLVNDRHRWAGWSSRPAEPGLLTVVVDDVRDMAEAGRQLAAVAAHRGEQRVEVLLVPHDNGWPDVSGLALVRHAELDARVLDVEAELSRPLHVNDALREARGEHVLLLSAGQRIESGGLDAWVRTLRDRGAAALHPVVLGPTLLVRDAGVVYPRQGRDPVGFLERMPFERAEWPQPVVEVPGAPFPLLARRDDVLELQGMRTLLRRLWADVDLSQRLAETTGAPVVVDADAVVVQPEATAFGRDASSAADTRTFAELWPTPPAGSAELWARFGLAPHFEGYAAASVPGRPSDWTRALWLPGRGAEAAAPVRPRVVEHAPALRWALRTAAPADERARAWGDLHFGRSLAEALRRLGQHAVVDYQNNSERATTSLDDVVVNLRGLRPVPLPADATSVAWVISHPDEVTAKELAGYDLRYAASTTWPRLMADQWGLDVVPLLQCTDAERFFLDDAAAAEVRDRILMVGNSRGQFRPAAWHSANAGLPVTIYGEGWAGQVPDDAVAGDHVPNGELRRFYGGARWVLNDHWPDMRDHGFVSNRIFDVLAAGGRLLTDDVTGLETVVPAGLLPRGVATFGSPAGLLATLAEDPSTWYPEDGVKAVSGHVRSAHSFDARARVLLDDVLARRAGAGHRP